MSRVHVPPLASRVGRLQPSAFVAGQAEMILSRLTGPIADVACGSGRNLIPFISSSQQIDCYDIRIGDLDPYFLEKCGANIVTHEVDLLGETFRLPKAKYALVVLVHFYDARILTKVVQAIRPGGFLVLETVDDRGGNYIQLPRIGEIFQAIAPTMRVLCCQSKPAGPKSDRQVVKLLAERLHKNT